MERGYLAKLDILQKLTQFILFQKFAKKPFLVDLKLSQGFLVSFHKLQSCLKPSEEPQPDETMMETNQ